MTDGWSERRPDDGGQDRYALPPHREEQAARERGAAAGYQDDGYDVWQGAEGGSHRPPGMDWGDGSGREARQPTRAEVDAGEDWPSQASGHFESEPSDEYPWRERSARPGEPDPPAAKSRSKKSRLIELPVLVIVAAVLALLVKTFAVQVFSVPTGSMVPTIDPGDKVLVNKMVYDFRSVQPGDIVVFPTAGLWFPQPKSPSSPWVWVKDEAITLFSEPPGPPYYIKRVIGVSGDHVACCSRLGQIMVNGAPLSESSYLAPGIRPGSFTNPEGEKFTTYKFAVTVPKGDIWVMGDDRDDSEDSRYYRLKGVTLGGFIPENRVVGRAFMIIAPFSRWGILNIPQTFLQPKVVDSASAAMAAANPAGAGLLTPAADGMTAMAAPLVPAAPLVLGFTGALPLTWLQRRLRPRARRGVSRLWARCWPSARRPRPSRWPH